MFILIHKHTHTKPVDKPNSQTGLTVITLPHPLSNVASSWRADSEDVDDVDDDEVYNSPKKTPPFRV